MGLHTLSNPVYPNKENEDLDDGSDKWLKFIKIY